ncbi:MAG: DUF6883 domain-containing protein [Cyanobacteria bacterium P01_A01_bin.15]
MTKAQLPNYAQTYIQPDKLTRYLLSEVHPVGKAKAKFFRGLGFNDGNVALLEKGLLNLDSSSLQGRYKLRIINR